MQEVVDKRVREMFGQSDTEKNISFSKCATAAPRRAPPALLLRSRCTGMLLELGGSAPGLAHARTCAHMHAEREREREREREGEEGGRKREGERGRRRALKAGRRWRGGRALLNSCRITPALCASFRFVAIQKRSSNLKDGKQSAAMVPQVKGLAYVTDPSMQHLL